MENVPQILITLYLPEHLFLAKAIQTTLMRSIPVICCTSVATHLHADGASKFHITQLLTDAFCCLTGWQHSPSPSTALLLPGLSSTWRRAYKITRQFLPAVSKEQRFRSLVASNTCFSEQFAICLSHHWAKRAQPDFGCPPGLFLQTEEGKPTGLAAAGTAQT